MSEPFKMENIRLKLILIYVGQTSTLVRSQPFFMSALPKMFKLLLEDFPGVGYLEPISITYARELLSKNSEHKKSIIFEHSATVK